MIGPKTGSSSPSLAGGVRYTCTVVVCTVDRPGEVERCLRSLSDLRYPSFEVLVVDNASTDSSAMRLAQEFGARYVFDPVPGLSHARNVGARACDTDIVAFLDDDAVAEPEWLDALAVEFQDPEVAAVVGRILPLKMESEAERLWAQTYMIGWGSKERLVVGRHTPGWFASAAFGGLGTGGCMAFRRKTFGVWRGFNERLGRGTPLDGNEEHYAFYSLVRLGYKVVGTPHAIVHHPCPPTLDALRQRRLKDQAALSGYLCLMLIEEKGYRLETVHHIFRKVFDREADRTQKRAGARVTSRLSSFLARMQGPWLYVLGTWKAHGNSRTSRALAPYLARALSHPQTASASGAQDMKQVSALPQPRRASTQGDQPHWQPDPAHYKSMSNVDSSTAHAEITDGLAPSERRKLMRDGLVNNLTLIVSGLVGVVLVPLMLKWLGQESYGIWIVAVAMTGLVATVDLGLYQTVVREVSSLPAEPDSKRSSFVEGAGNAYLLLGIFGALLLGILGYILSDRLHISLQLQRIAQFVFWLLGIGFLADQLNVFGGAILIGLRRFDCANFIKSGAAIFRAGGIVVLLAMGGSLTSIALWQAFAAAVGAAVTFIAVRHLVPHFRFRVAHLHWEQLRQKISFAVSSLLTIMLGSLAWQSGSLLIGLMQGPASVVPFYIGRKFPYTEANIGWQTSETLFPAAGENQNSLFRTRDILKVGTRWVLALMLPVTILLWFVGSNLLTVWIGKLDPVALRVLQLLSLAALADAFMAASLNVLWGRAAMRQVVLTMLGVGLGTVCLTVALLPKMGVAGAAWATLLPTVAGAVTLFCLACRECQARVSRMARSVFRGLLFPVAGCALAAHFVSVWLGYGLWPLVGACLAGSVVYTLLLYVAPGQNEERLFLQSAFRHVISYL